MSPLGKQILGSAGTLFLYFTSGYLCGLQPLILVDLRHSSILQNEEQESWLLFTCILASLVSQFISRPLIDRYGRKMILIAASIPSSLACFLMYAAKDYETLLAGYLTAGLAAGGLWSGSIMVAEICSSKYRASILGSKLVFQVAGVILVCNLSSFWHWRKLAFYGSVPGVCGLISVVMAPESPAWLASKGRFRDCAAAFYSLRGSEDREELSKLIKDQEANEKIVNFSRKLMMDKLTYLLDNSLLKAVSISIALIVSIEFSGKNFFNAYVINVSDTSANGILSLYDNLLDVSAFIALLLFVLIVSKFKLRTLLFSVGLPAVSLLFIISVVQYSMSIGAIAYNSKLPVALFSVYFVMVNIGLSPVMHTLLSEIYPLSYRGIGISVISLVQYLITCVTSQLGSSITTSNVSMFLISGTVTCLSLVYLYKNLPETSNKILLDIEDSLKSDGSECEMCFTMVDLKDKLLSSPYPPTPSQLLNKKFATFIV